MVWWPNHPTSAAVEEPQGYITVKESVSHKADMAASHAGYAVHGTAS